MRVLVTGGAGFVGSHLCERLLEAGADVVAADNLVTGREENVAHLEGERRFAFVRADVSKGLEIDGRFDRIFHLASPASPIDFERIPLEILSVNADGTRLLLERAVRDGARFLLASTSEVYGDPLVHPQVESYFGNVNPNGIRSVYDESKRFAESATMAWRRARGADTRIIRIFNTYGPRMRPDDGRVVPAFAKAALAGRALPVFGDGSQTRSLCWVGDLVDGIARLMEATGEGAELPVNLGNPREMTMLELAEIVNRIAGNAAGIEFLPLPKDDPRRRRPDITRARTLLGWEPRVPAEEGLARTIDWFRTH